MHRFIGHRVKHLSWMTFCLIFMMEFAHATSGITYQGRLIKPDGTPVNSNNVQFRLQIRTPGAEDCLLYEETQSHDLSITNGTFAISLNDGSGLRQDSHHTWTLFDALSNRKAFSFTGGDCTGALSYNPSSLDNRKFRVFFNDGSGWEGLPIQTVNYIPMSIETYAVGGFNASSLMRVENAGTLGSVSPITTAQYNEILALVGGTTTQYARTNHLNGSVLPTIGSGQSVRWSGSAWEAYTPPTNASLPTCTAGQVLFSNGTALSCVTDGGAAAIDGDDITSGTVGGTTAWNTSGAITTTGAITGGSFSGSTVSTRDLRVYESTNTNHVSLQAPAGLTPNYTLTLPPDDGGTGQVLSTNGSGILSWVTPATGNVNLSNIRSIVNPMNHVFPSSACTTAQTLRYDSLTDTYSCSNITLAGTSVTGAVLNGGNTTGASVTVGTNDNFALGFETNGTTRMTLTNAGRLGIGTSNPLVPLEVSGTEEMVQIKDTQNATNPHYLFMAVNRSNAGYADIGAYQTGVGYIPLILNRSGGNVGIGTTSPARLLHVNTGMRLQPAALPGTGGAGDIFIDSNDGNKLKWHDGGAWHTVGTGTGTGDVINGGNTFGAGMTLGTNDSFSMDLETNNTPRISILSAGNVGVGTTAPTQLLHVYGASGPRIAVQESGTAAFGYFQSNGHTTRLYGSTGSAGSLALDSITGALSNAEVSIHRYTNTSAQRMFRIYRGNNTNAIDHQIESGTSGTTFFAAAGGSVGIGTTNPARLFQVQGAMRLHPSTLASVTTPDAGDLFVDSGDGNKLKWHNGTTWQTVGTGSGSGDVLLGGNTAGGAMTLGNNSNFALNLETNNTARMTILNTGNVGIGTSTPAQTLSVLGKIAVGPNLPADTGADLQVENTSTNKPYVTIDSSGNQMALGYSDAAAAGVVSVSAGKLYLKTGHTWNAPPTDNGTVALTVSGTNIGIGTTSPSRLLHVNGPMRMTASTLAGVTSPGAGDMVVDSSDGNKLKWHNGTTWQTVGTGSGSGDVLLGGNSAGAAMTLGNNDNFALNLETNNTARMTILGNGNVGIGTTNPSHNLEIYGTSTRLKMNATSNVDMTGLLFNEGATIAGSLMSYNSGRGDYPNGLLLTNYRNGPTIFSNNSSETMRITGAGDVGIGTTAPNSTLQVNGRFVAGVTTETDALNIVNADFSASNMVRMSSSGACNILNFTNVEAGGSYTVTMPGATTTCNTIYLQGAATNVKKPAGYTGGVSVSGVVYTAIYDGTTLWVSYVPF